MFLSFLPRENAKMNAKQSILEHKRILKENCIMNVLIVYKNHKAKNAKLVYMEKFLRYQNAETHE